MIASIFQMYILVDPTGPIKSNETLHCFINNRQNPNSTLDQEGANGSLLLCDEPEG